MKRQVILSIALLGIVFCPAEKVFAYGCCALTLNAITRSKAMVVGKITSRISTAQTEIARAIYSSSNDIQKAIGKAAALQSKINTDVQAKIAQKRQKSEAAKAIGKAKIRSGQRYQLPPSDCTSMDSSSKIVGIRETQKKIANKLSQGLTYRNLNFGSPKRAVWEAYNTHKTDYCGESTSKLMQCKSGTMPDADINIESLLSGAGEPGKATDYSFAYTQQKAAKAFIKNVVNPIPDEKISPELAKEQGGKAFIVKQLAKEAKMSLAAKPFIDALAWRTPIKGLGTQLQRIWNETNKVGISVPAGFLQQFSGKKDASPLAFLQTEVDRRAGNSQWYVDMAKASPEARLTELAYMQALGLQLRMNELMRLEKIELLLGGIYAQKIEDSPENRNLAAWYAGNSGNGK